MDLRRINVIMRSLPPELKGTEFVVELCKGFYVIKPDVVVILKDDDVEFTSETQKELVEALSKYDGLNPGTV